MPPKRRDKEATDTSVKNIRGELCQADHELFLQAFEKPTQIYRFLRSRNMICPIFLNRTLTYMHSRMSRSNKTRKSFKINNMLERMEQAQSQNNSGQPLPGFMTLTFLGCYDKTGEKHVEPVKVETLLLKICHKKRKDVSCPVQTKSLGVSLVAHNPSDECPPPKVPALSIPTECFSLTDQANQAKSYHLLLRVRMPPVPPSSSLPALPPTPASESDSADPPQKKRKLNKEEEEAGALVVAVEGEARSEKGECVEYGTDLIVYDKQNRCQLSDGDYELLLEPLTPGSKISHTLCCWESIGPIKEEEGDHLCSSFKQFRMCPVIKFHLRWSREPVSKFVHRPSNSFSLPLDDTLDSNSNKENFRPEKEEAGAGNNVVGSGGNKGEENRLQIVYQFLYNNNSRQQTEACEDLHCPWCSLDCSTLYSLLKHLKLCHSRFTFTYVPIPGGARIDVAINEYYDGSYSGCPQDLICQPPGMAFSRAGPVRRTCVSHILVCHPKRPQPSLSEFLELDENEFDGQRPYITGHNRLYHHTTTCLPVYPKEMEIDSEDENDPKWLQTKTMMMIDDFTDVNEGEKELMKMWNLHVMRHGYVGDCQIPLACTMFLQAKGQELLKKNLYRNFVLHMCSLFDFGLVSPVTVYTTIQRLQELVVEGGDASKVLQQSCVAQREHWVAEGASRATEPRRPTVAVAVASPAERRKPKRPASPPPPSKKKPNVSGKTAVADNNKKKLVEKLNEKEREKCETVTKKKAAVSGAIVAVPKTLNSTQSKERESAAALSLRRKSSTTAEGTNPVVLLRRKSFAGATEALRKKTLENGVSNGVVGVNHRSGVS